MEKLQEDAVGLLYHLLDVCDQRLRHRENEEVRISAPQMFIDLVYVYHKDALAIKNEQRSEHLFFCGIEIIPNYEMALVIFHKEYPLIGEKWMIKRIDLNSHIPGGNRIILELNKPSDFEINDQSENTNPVTFEFEIPDRPDVPVSEPDKT